MHNVIKEIKPNDGNVEANFRRYLNIIVAIFALTLGKQGNKYFCPVGISFQAEMVILGYL